MNANDPNMVLIEAVAIALEGLTEPVIYVGGCASGLLITDATRPPIRATQDVDLIAQVTTVANYYCLQKNLRERGLREDSEVLCRWRLGQIKIDVVPTDKKILGFSNRWYALAAEQFNTVELPSGQRIALIASPYFMATKLEAFHDRGNGDFGASHDMEDIIALVDGRPELGKEIVQGGAEVREYLREEVDELLADGDFVNAVPWHFRPDAANQDRVELVIERLRRIAGL